MKLLIPEKSMQDPAVSQIKVKNRAPAPIQITAEQLIREANERKDILFKPLKRSIEGEEGDENKLFKRKHYEDLVKRFPNQISNWLRYSQWEERINELERARSILERAADIDPRSITLWLRYAEFEIRNKNINCARNVFLRAIHVLPRVDQFWYKFAYMEERLGNLDHVRNIYQDWIKWEPSEEIWYSYIKFEQRHAGWKRIREIYYQLLQLHCTSANWIKFANFEIERFNFDSAKEVYEKALQVLHDDEVDAKLFGNYAKVAFKFLKYPIEKVRQIFQNGLQRLKEREREILYSAYLIFEKQFGTCKEIDRIVLEKRRKFYQNALESNPKNYDLWYDYARLEEENGNFELLVDIYSKAVDITPSICQKKYWKRYIYLWIYWATAEESVLNSIDSAERVYQKCIEKIPHSQFTFAKIWIFYAKLLIRKADFSTARKLLGRAIGTCPKPRIFDCYIELELQLKEFDRVRKIYEKYIDWDSNRSLSWIKFANFENALGEYARSRAIFELALQQSSIDDLEYLWKSYIDFEIEINDTENARRLYERLLSLSEHVKIWISFAKFESSHGTADSCRSIFKRAYKSLKNQELDEERVLLLMTWKEFESNFANNDVNLSNVEKMFPIKTVKEIPTDVDSSGIILRQASQTIEYQWPDSINAKEALLDMARKWKASKGS